MMIKPCLIDGAVEPSFSMLLETLTGIFSPAFSLSRSNSNSTLNNSPLPLNFVTVDCNETSIFPAVSFVVSSCQAVRFGPITGLIRTSLVASYSSPILALSKFERLEAVTDTVTRLMSDGAFTLFTTNLARSLSKINPLGATACRPSASFTLVTFGDLDKLSPVRPAI